jgi:class 3 adenylate cyclase/tetratricopeptide (TPR) repeat protein
MKCPSCGTDNRRDNAFCGTCGTKLAIPCSECGNEVPPGDSFCGKCGLKLATSVQSASKAIPNLESQFAAMQSSMPASFASQILAHADGENRLVTVLFADMSNSVATTADMAPDEAAELVNNLLKAMVDAFTRYEGRVDRFLGDGALAVFGTPFTHENDPERAILAAQEICDRATELGLQVTAGINTGRVYFGAMGSDEHRELTVIGPVVNLAARIQGKAEAGEILIGETTQRHVRRAFALTRREAEIKGIEGAITVYRVDRQLPRMQKARGLENVTAELIGRDDELARLLEAYELTTSGEGQLACLSGEAGLGKTRLIAELRRHVEKSDRPPIWLEGRCVELDVSPSYWPFIDLFREYFGLSWQDEAGGPAQKIRDGLKALAAKDLLSENRVKEIGCTLGRLLSVTFGDEWDHALAGVDSEVVRNMSFLAIRDLLLALAKDRPVILVLDDLHWADGISIDMISFVMESLTLAPLLVVCVYRPDRDHRCIQIPTVALRKCPARFAEIPLRELTPRECRRMILSLLAVGDLPSDLRSMILTKSQGNPLFVEEVVRSLIDSGVIFLNKEDWKTRADAVEVAVPETVQGIILSRIDRLDENLKHLLQSASVIGRLFGRRLLESISKRELDESLGHLEDQALIYQERAVPEQEYAFKHVLARDAVYEGIVERTRARFHGQVADAIQTLYSDALEEHYEQLAYHYKKSGNSDKAVEYNLKAGEKAKSSHLNDEALSYFADVLAESSRLLDEAKAEEVKLAAITAMGELYYRDATKDSLSEMNFRRAIELAGKLGVPNRKLVRLYFWLGLVLYRRRQHDELETLGREGLALLADDSECVEAALMNSRISVAQAMGDFEYTRRNVAFIDRHSLSDELVVPYTHIITMYQHHKEPIEAAKWLKILKKKAADARNVRASARVELGYGDILRHQGDIADAKTRYQNGIEMSERIGDRETETLCRVSASRELLAIGNVTESVEKAAQALYVATNTRLEPYARWIYGLALLCDGKENEGIAHLHDVAIEPYRREEVGDYAFALRLNGEREQAQERFREVIDTQVNIHPGDLYEIAKEQEVLANAVSGLENTFEDESAFREHCRESIVAIDPDFQWHLRRGSPSRFEISIDPPPNIEHWIDRFGDCSYVSGETIEIRAANGRDLWWTNLSAPRLVFEVSDNFAFQLVCSPISPHVPAIGGIVVWKNESNYLRLDWGTRGPNEVSFSGCMDEKDIIVGRGRILSECIELRLQRIGERMTAFASTDGAEWFEVGESLFSVNDPIELGLVGIGKINRSIYRGAFAEGTAIQFRDIQLWTDAKT